MSSSKVSIVVPNYNKEDRLQRCLSSLLNQTYRNMEVVFVDDGSTDQSLSIAARFADADSRLRLYERPHEGKLAAINFGMSQVTGDWVKLHGSDDELCRTAIFEALSCANSNVLIHNSRLLYPHGVGRLLYEPSVFRKVQTVRADKVVPTRTSFAAGLYFFHRRIVEKLFPVPEQFHYEDWYILWAVKRTAEPITVLDRPLTLYWQDAATLWGGIDNTDRHKLRWRARRDLRQIQAFAAMGEPIEAVREAELYVRTVLYGNIWNTLTSKLPRRTKLRLLYHRYPFIARATILLRRAYAVTKTTMALRDRS